MKKLILLFIFLITLVPSVYAEEAKGIILIPSINLNEPIVLIPMINNQWDTSNMEFAGWLEGTYWVDEQKSRTVIIGHTPGAFMNVYKVQIGDAIIILSGDQPYYYEVYEILVTDINDTQYYMPTQNHVLTIITCEGDLRRIVNAYPKDN